MRTCPRCRRHVYATEPACPFCGGALPLADGPRGFGVALGLALVSCGPGRAVDGSSPTTTDTTSSGPTLSSSTGGGVDGVDGTGGPTTTGISVGDDETDDDCGGCCGGFYGGCPADVGNVFECNVLAQNCGDGEKCMPWSNDGGPAWNATRCSPLAADPVPLGGACMVEGSAVSGVDECDVGLMCWEVDENNLGYCEDFCTGDQSSPVCESPDDVCYRNNDGAIALCIPGCDPVLQDCADSHGCWEAGDEWACQLDVTGGTALPGATCAFSPDCNPGLVCLSAEFVSDCASEVGCCTSVCDLTAADPDSVCTAVDQTATCEPWYVPGFAPAGLDHVGVCVRGEEETTG